jgi:hypothetical protein
MPFEITVIRSAQYVRYDAAGPTSLKNFVDLISFAGAETEHYEDLKVLFDLRGVEGRLTSAEQLLVGEVVAIKLPLAFKVASLVPVGEITRNTERVAVSKGVTTRVFDSESEALLWLLDGKPS